MFLLNDPRDEAPLEVYPESNRAGRTFRACRAVWCAARRQKKLSP